MQVNPVHFLDFAALYDSQEIERGVNPDMMAFSFMIKMPDCDTNDQSIGYLGADVQNDEDILLFNAKYQDRQIIWQGRNGETVGLDLRGTGLADMPVDYFKPAFFIAFDGRVGAVLMQGALLVTDD